MGIAVPVNGVVCSGSMNQPANVAPSTGASGSVRYEVMSAPSFTELVESFTPS